MSSSSLSLYYYYSFYLFLIFIIFHGTSDVAQDLIKQTCARSAKTDLTIKYDFCVASLQQVPRSHCADLKGLGLVAIQLAEANATHTHSFIMKLLKHKGHIDNPYCKSCLEDCLKLYSDAISAVKDGIKEFKSKRYSEANIKVSAAMDASTTCEDGFEEQGQKSPLLKNDEDMFQLTALALSIINMLV